MAEPSPVGSTKENSDDKTSKVEQFFGGTPWRVAFKIAAISLVVGIVLSVQYSNPGEVLRDIYSAFGNVIDAVRKLGFNTIESVGKWLLLGAAIVLPIWLLARVIKYFGSK